MAALHSAPQVLELLRSAAWALDAKDSTTGLVKVTVKVREQGTVMLKEVACQTCCKTKQRANSSAAGPIPMPSFPNGESEAGSLTWDSSSKF